MTRVPSATVFNAPTPTEINRLEAQLNTLLYRGRNTPVDQHDTIRREMDSLQRRYKDLTGREYQPPELSERGYGERKVIISGDFGYNGATTDKDIAGILEQARERKPDYTNSRTGTHTPSIKNKFKKRKN